MGGTIPGLVIVGSITMMMSNTVSSTHLWPLNQHLPPGSCSVCVPALSSFNDGKQYKNMAK